MKEQNNINPEDRGGMAVIIGIVIVVLVVAAGAAYYFLVGTTEEEASVVSETVVTDTVQDTHTNESEVKTFEVDGENFEFSVEKIEVNHGDTVKIVFNNVSGTHNWQVDEFNAATEIIQTGETAEVMFVADTSGAFEYYCAVGNHRAQGMVGTLVVN